MVSRPQLLSSEVSPRLSCLTLKSVSGRGGWACAQPANPEDSQVHKGTKEMGQDCLPQQEAQENPCPKAVPPGP